MTHAASVDEKEVIFINERSRRDYIGLPEDVREAADQALHALQNGRRLPAKMLDQLDGSLTGIDEVKIPYDDDTYRVYVDQGSRWVIIVLDAGMKKSPRGGEIPKPDKERLEERLKKSKTFRREQEQSFKAAYESRVKLREKAALRQE